MNLTPSYMFFVEKMFCKDYIGGFLSCSQELNPSSSYPQDSTYCFALVIGNVNKYRLLMYLF